MKISLKELLKLEKYLNGLGRRIKRINRFGMDSEPMDIDSMADFLYQSIPGIYLHHPIH